MLLLTMVQMSLPWVVTVLTKCGTIMMVVSNRKLWQPTPTPVSYTHLRKGAISMNDGRVTVRDAEKRMLLASFIAVSYTHLANYIRRIEIHGLWHRYDIAQGSPPNGLKS